MEELILFFGDMNMDTLKRRKYGHRDKSWLTIENSGNKVPIEENLVWKIQINKNKIKHL